MRRKGCLRLILILAVLAGLVGYGLFSTFLFSPHEGRYSGDVSTLVPRNVDFFVARSGLLAAFDDFPRVKGADEVEALPAWQTFVGSPEYDELIRQNGVEQAMANLRATDELLPLGLSLPAIFGGRDVSIAGYLRGKDLAQADWAVYGTLNWAGKLGLSAMRYPGLTNLEAQGFTVEKADGWITITGGGLQRPVHIARIKDVAIVSTTTELMSAASDLENRGGQDSFGQSARYFDHIQNALSRKESKKRNQIEVFVDVLKLQKELGLTGSLPDVKSQDFLPRFAGRLFQLGALKEVEGIIGIDEGLDVDLHGEFSSEHISAAQARIYRQQGIDRASLIDEVARMAPADTSLMVYIQGHVGELFRQLVDAMDADTRTILEDAFRSTGKYSGLEQLTAELQDSVRNRLLLVVRPHDYPDDPDGPPHDSTPVFAASLIVWTQDRDKVFALRDAIGQHGRNFGLKGRNEGELGYFKNFEGGFESREYWNHLIPGTGVIATTTAQEHTIVSNHHEMLRHMLKTRDVGGTQFPRLSDRADFLALAQTSLHAADLVVWTDPRTAAETLRKQARMAAEVSVLDKVDWRPIRRKAEQDVMREQFPGKRIGSLSGADQEQFESLVDAKIESIEQRMRSEQLPALVARHERLITYSEAITSSLLMLSLDPKRFDLSLRVVVPID